MPQKYARLIVICCAFSLVFMAANFTDAQSCDYSVAASDSSTLISTIEQANSNELTETICLGGGIYTITNVYETGTDGTVSLPLITTSLIIEGNNSTIADASSSDYLFELSLYLSLTLNDLTINDNRVYNNGDLYYDNVQTFGGGIDSWGTFVSIDNSLFDSGGIAVDYPRGTVLINNSTFTNNTPNAIRSTSPTGDIEIYDSNFSNNGGAESGGALSTRGDVVIARSNFSDNYAEEYGGAIWVSHTITITDSVVMNNTAGAVYISSGYGTVSINNNCIDGNINTAITVNSSPEIINAENNWWGSMFTPANGKQGSGNAIGNAFIDYEPYLTTPILGCTAPPAQTIDQRIGLDTDTSTPVVLATLEGLAPFSFTIDTLPSNGTLSGADETWTYTPSSGFTGHDSFTYTMTDDNSTSDSGTIYLDVGVEPLPTIIVDTNAQEVPFVDNGNCTLGEAIHAANTNTAVDACPAGTNDIDDVIALANTTYTFNTIDNDTVTITYGDPIGANALPIVYSDIIIQGNGAIIERGIGAALMRFFYIQSPHDGAAGQLTLQNLTLQNGHSTNHGGAIWSVGNVNLENVNFYNNQSDRSGGAIYGGFDSIDSSVFDNNVTHHAGGGAYLYNTSISNSIFTNNMTLQNPGGGGGGIWLNSNADISDTLVQNNHSAYYGGGIYLSGSNNTANLTNVRILDNIADTDGGGAYVLDSGTVGNSLNITNSCIVGNIGRDINVRYPSGANLTNNWWGAHDGPSEIGNGYGEAIGGNAITFEPFLTIPPAGCPVLDPVALDDTYAVLSRSSVDIILSAGGGLPAYTYAVVTQPQQGTLTGTAPNLTYTPNNAYLGSDSFTFEATDSDSGTSTPATISINISTDLAATSRLVDVPYETARDFTLAATGGTAPYTFTLLETPDNGTLTGNEPNLTYTPNAEFSGNDSLTFEVTDIDGFTSTGLVSFNVNSEFGMNSGIYHFVTPAVQRILPLNIQGGLPPFTVNLTPSANAEASYNSGTIYYTMDEGYSGVDTLDIEIIDDFGEQLFITYSMSSAEPMVVNTIEIQVPYETTSSFTLSAVGGNPPYTSEVINTTFAGTLIETSELNYQYTPQNSFSGFDYAYVRVTDSFGFYAENYVYLVVHPELVLDDVNLSVNYEYPTQVPVSASGGSAPYIYSVQTPPTNGTITGTSPDFTYTPNTGFSGSDTFELNVTDDLGSVKTVTYTMTVAAPINVSDLSGLITALQNAYDTQQALTINLTSGTYTLTEINNTISEGGNGLPPIRSNVVINANDATIIRDEASGQNFRFFEVETTGILTIRDLTLEKGEVWNATDGGGAILSYGQLTVENSHFIDNRASSSTPGGAITARNSDLSIIDSTFTNSRANNGGAIYASSNIQRSVTITNTVFESNYSYNNGGALTLSGNLISAVITDSTFSNNTTQGDLQDNGGAIASSATVTINTSNFDNNSAYYGGAVYVGSGTVTINTSNFDNNSAYYGGAVYVGSGTVTINTSNFDNNSAYLIFGAGIYITNTGIANISGSNFLNHFGSAITNYSGRAIIVDSKFLENEIGVVARRYVSLSTTDISNSCFINNVTAADASNDRISADNNWWGSFDGPSGDGTGYGDNIANDVRFEPFLTTPPNNCLSNDPVILAQTSYVETELTREISFAVNGGLPPFTFNNISAPLNGTIIGDASDGVFEYQSDLGYLGSDTISFDVTDSLGGTASGVLDIVVRAELLNEIHTINIPMDTPTEIELLSDSGILPFTVLSIGSATNGEVLWESDDTVYYIPEPGFIGTDSFTYQLQDAIGKTATHTVQVTTIDRSPATIFVDSTLLENPLTDNGNCTLLEALSSAYDNVAYDACAAGSDTETDIVYVPAGVYQLDRPGNGGDNVIVRGAGINQTIIESLPPVETMLFYVNTGHTATYELMTIRNGGGLNYRDGAAFYNEGVLTINRIAAVDNYANRYGSVVYMPQDTTPVHVEQFIAYNSIFLNNESGYRGNVVYGRSDTSAIFVNNVFQYTPPNNGAVYDDMRLPTLAGIHNCFLASQQIESFIDDDLRFNWGNVGLLRLDSPPDICDAMDLFIPVSISGTITDYKGDDTFGVLVGFEDAATGTITGVTCATGSVYSFDSTTVEPPRTELIIYAGGIDDPSISCDDFAAGRYHREWFDNVFDASSATIVDLTSVDHITGIDFQLTQVGTPPQAHTVRPIANIGDITPDITWQVVNYSSSYEINLTGPPTFEEVTFTGTDRELCNMVTDICTVSGTLFNPPLPLGTYMLRVRGITPTGVLGAWSTSQFVVTLPPQPIITAPSGIIIDSTPTITWLVDGGADSYEISLVGDTYNNIWTVLPTLCIARRCDAPVPAMLPPGNYSVMVRGQNGLGFGNWSPAQTFTVKFNTPIDIRITAIASENEIVAGDNLSFDLSVQNLGPNTATGLSAIYTLPSNFSFVSDTLTACTPSGLILTCNLDLLSANTQHNFSITLNADEAHIGGLISHSFSIDSFQIDTNTVNNTASANVTVRPVVAIPTSLVANALSETTIQIDWVDNASDETEYRVEMQNAQAEWVEVEILSANTTTFTSNDLTCDTNYLYRVRAYRLGSDSFSPYSNESVGLTSPCSPTELTALIDVNNDVQLNYILTIGSATNVIIERSLDGVNFATVDTIATTPPQYVDTTAVCETLHYYRVLLLRSGDGASSNYSNVVTIQTPLCPPTNDDHTTASSITSLPYSDTQQHGGATNEITDPMPICSTNNANSVWYQFTPAQNGNYHFTTQRSQFDVTLSIWTWAGSFNAFGCDKDSALDGQAAISRSLQSGVTYYIMLSGNNDMNAHATLNVSRLADPTPTPPPTVAPLPTMMPPAVENTVGLFDPTTNLWQFRDANASGNVDVTFTFGTGLNNQPLIGDWDGDNVDGIGLYRNGVFIFRNLSNAGSIDNIANFGPAENGWQAIAGDWNGNNTDSIGIYKDGQFMLSDDNSTLHYVFNFGPIEAGWTPLAGDWNGDGFDTIGLYKDGIWLLSTDSANPRIYGQIAYGPVNSPEWRPVVGDWNADDMTTIGLYGSGLWRVRNTDNFGGTELAIHFGSVGTWIPLSSYRGGNANLNALGAAPMGVVAPPLPTTAPTEVTPEHELTPEVTEPIAETGTASTPEPEATEGT